MKIDWFVIISGGVMVSIVVVIALMLSGVIVVNNERTHIMDNCKLTSLRAFAYKSGLIQIYDCAGVDVTDYEIEMSLSVGGDNG